MVAAQQSVLHHQRGCGSNSVPPEPSAAPPARQYVVPEHHLKARQLGFSTFILVFILDRCLFNSNVRAGVIAHTQPDAQVLFRDKVKFAYDHLPDWLRAEIPARNDNAGELVFTNNSSIRVGTSMRSGTVQYLHISEYGYISLHYPDKAAEIKTGAFNAVAPGQFIFVESTAKGAYGEFYDMCQEAQRVQAEGLPLTELDFKLHFEPWYTDLRYTLDPSTVVLTQEETDYLDQLEHEIKLKLTPGQRAWYAKKSRQQGERMKQEYPSTPKEAFEVAIAGAYYGQQMLKARMAGRIGEVPHEPALLVNTFWDLGHDDSTAIWFHQRVGLENRWIDYYEENGEPLSHYVKLMQDKGYAYGDHYLPHDVEVTELGSGKSRLEVLDDLGVKQVIVVPRIDSILEGIEMVRNVLGSCWFDAAKCDKGIKALDHYQKEWDDKRACFKSHPLRNWATHGADAFRQFAQGYLAPARKRPRRKGNWRTR